MCEECIADLKKRECPSCLKFNFAARPSIIARRMIGLMACDCPNDCEEKSTIGSLKDHLRKCPKRKYCCTGVEECKFEGNKAEFIKHIMTEHEIKFLSLFDSSIAKEIQDEEATNF
jgi:hypothetical protein